MQNTREVCMYMGAVMGGIWILDFVAIAFYTFSPELCLDKDYRKATFTSYNTKSQILIFCESTVLNLAQNILFLYFCSLKLEIKVLE